MYFWARQSNELKWSIFMQMYGFDWSLGFVMIPQNKPIYQHSTFSFRAAASRDQLNGP